MKFLAHFCLAVSMISVLVCLATMPYNGLVSLNSFFSFLLFAMIADAIEVSTDE